MSAAADAGEPQPSSGMTSSAAPTRATSRSGRELAAAAGEPILDLGCGTGRVALDLARHGHRVHGLDLDPELVAAFNERARAAGLPATATAADAREFDLGEEFGMVLAPMQFVQVLGGAAERLACLRCVRRHLRPGGRLAVAIVDGMPAELTEEAPLPSPTPARSTAGSTRACRWTPASTRARSSSAACARPSPRRATLSDELDEIPLRLLSAETVEAEAREAGLAPAGRREIPPTDSHVGSRRRPAREAA